MWMLKLTDLFEE